MTQAEFDTQFPPVPGRVHEVYGAGANVFAACLAGHTDHDVLWFVEGWKSDVLNPIALQDFCDPSKVLLAKADSQTTLLAASEEALRDGSAPLVVLELSKPLGLTEGRRLQLAAQAGKSTGLCLIGEDAGSNAAETRWQCHPIFDAMDSTLHHWKLKKNKKGTLGAWNVRWHPSTHRIIVVPPVAQRPGF